MADLFSVSMLSFYLTLGGIVVGIVAWGRSLTEKLNRIESNHLTHIQESGEQTVLLLTEIKTILTERER